VKNPVGKKKHSGLHRGFEHLSVLDDPRKTLEVIERITGRRGNFRAMLEEFEQRYLAVAAPAQSMPSEDTLAQSVARDVTPIDLSAKFVAVETTYLQIPHEYTDRIAPTLHPYGDIFYRKAWRESYGRGRRVFFRAGLQFMLRGTSLKSRRAVETGRDNLVEKRLIIRATNDPAPHKGTLYRVVSPSEYLKGMLSEGVPLEDIPVEGVPCKDPSRAL